VTAAYITSRKPADVAREVELCVRQGCRAFVLAGIDCGHMLDLERLGAARYAAGIQAQVVLEFEPEAAQSSPASGAAAAGVVSSTRAR